MFDRRQLLRTTAAFAVSGPAPRALAAEKPSIKVGTILPLTGPAADNGVLYNAALKLAVEDVNAAGGVNGSKLEWLQEDDRSLVPVAVGCLRKLERLSAVVVLGPPTAACWEAVEPITKEIKLPTLCFTSSRLKNSAQPYALRMAPTDDTAIPEGVAEFVKLHASVKKIAIAGDAQDARGMEFIASVARDFGLEIVATAACQPRTTDFSADALTIREANPEAVFIGAREATALPLVKELEAQGFDKPILLNSQAWASTGFIHAVEAAGKNVYTIGFSTNDPDPANPKYNAYVKRFLESTKATTKLPQPANVCNTTLAYDAVFLVADIMRKGGVDGDTTAAQAREIIKAGLDGLKTYQGFNKITLRDSSDGHIQCHLLKANAQTRQWDYALAPDQRIQTPAAFKARG